ncbi:MAG: DUF3034 family protein [Acetobacteraceae bacterium]|nr:DUF3034 family protein [Acetobacteraceae bacterium]
MLLTAAPATRAGEPGPAETTPARPINWAPESGKLLATAGVTEIEGSGGGGLVPWALITGYGTKDAVGANAHYTYVHTSSFDLHTAGAAIGLYDRVELSIARQWFDTRAVGAKLGLGANYTFAQTVAGAKVRLFGEAVYDQDSWLPQIAVGAQYKSNNRSALLSAIGAKSADGVDFYVAGTKLFLAESLLLNATLRATKANQFGLLGFGGDRSNAYSAEFEGSAAYLLSRTVALGGEFRTKPDKLRFAREDNAWDLFAAWFLDKHISATLAYVNLGRIAQQPSQSGIYVSLQAGF